MIDCPSGCNLGYCLYIDYCFNLTIDCVYQDIWSSKNTCSVLACFPFDTTLTPALPSIQGSFPFLHVDNDRSHCRLCFFVSERKSYFRPVHLLFFLPSSPLTPASLEPKSTLISNTSLKQLNNHILSSKQPCNQTNHNNEMPPPHKPPHPRPLLHHESTQHHRRDPPRYLHPVYLRNGIPLTGSPLLWYCDWCTFCREAQSSCLSSSFSCW